MNSIEIKNFSKSYKNILAVDAIDLSIQAGEIVGFVGKNGAGKSTTIRAMMNMIFPTEGTITVAGFDSVKEAKKIRQVASYMSGETAFQENITSRELFVFASKFAKEGVEKALELAHFFELDVDKKIAALSLGNRKKVSVIVSLLKHSDLIVLDEPTSGLDPLMQEKFFEMILKEKKRGATIFLSSHNLSEIEKYCDRVAIIKDGKIVDFLDMKNVQIQRKQSVTYKTKDGKEETFVSDGNINELVKRLAALDLISLEIKTNTVEDEFIKYYKEESKDA